MKTDKQNTVGLVGFPVAHSASKAYFEQKWRHINLADVWCYKLWPITEISNLRKELASETQLVGFNVTIPHKRAVISVLDVLSPEAAAIGAVNTVVVQNSIWTGYNTDVVGVELSLSLLDVPEPAKALIFGTGGAAQAVAFVLRQRGIHYQFVSRTPHPDLLSYHDVTQDILFDYRLLIHATPVGMWPDTSPWPLQNLHLTPYHRLFDLIYKPTLTPFMRWGLPWRAHVLNGTPMLHAQADAAWLLWQQAEVC
jgi:shikimate dehydrogenase